MSLHYLVKYLEPFWPAVANNSGSFAPCCIMCLGMYINTCIYWSTCSTLKLLVRCPRGHQVCKKFHLYSCNLQVFLRLLQTTTTTLQPTVLRPFFRDHPGEPVPEENFWTLWWGKINRGRHTDHPAGHHSIWTNQCPPPPSSPFFYGPDALPAAQPTVSKHWRQLASWESCKSRWNWRMAIDVFFCICSVRVGLPRFQALTFLHIFLCICSIRWCGVATGRALDLRLIGRGFKSCSGQRCVATLGKLFTPTCMTLSPSSMTWCQPKGGDALQLGR